MRKDLMQRTLFLLIVLLAATSWGQQAASTTNLPAAPSSQKLPSKDTVESFMHHWFGYDSSITWQVAQIQPSEVPGFAQVMVAMEKGGQQQQMVLYITPDEKHAFTGEVIPFGADPFAPARKELATSTTGIARGPASAQLTIVEFSDLECPHCKQAQPILEKLMGDFPNARLVFQQFPIEALHPWALRAATWAECIGRENNAAFWKFVNGVLDDQLNIDAQNADAKMKEHATAAGADAARAATCAASLDAAKAVRDSFELGKAVGVTGTPTVFINGRKVGGVTSIPYEMLKDLAHFAESTGSK
ncbi:MAG: thioredoxin domain-containing protein [Terriglobales bacterium]